jgi:acyl-CoA thioester hydrolase
MKATDYPASTKIDVRFRDLDAMGHVNNAVYFTYLEVARFYLISRIFCIESVQNLPVILGEATCRYLSPAYLGESLTIGLAISRIGGKSFDVVYQIDGQDGRLVASARTTMIMFDYVLSASTPIPDTIRTQLQELQLP